MKYIVTNFAYGTGPYLRTTELALAINKELESQGRERFGIIVPWVYSEKQKKIMLEEFGPLRQSSSEASAVNQKYPSEILLDIKLGGLLKSVFYGDNSYEEALRLWVENYESASGEAHKHLSGEIVVEDLKGEKKTISGQDIVMELNRAPRISYNIVPSYGATFAYISEILENALGVSADTINVNRELVERAIPIARNLEKSNRINFLAEPSSFSYLSHRDHLYANEKSAPPIARPPYANGDKVAEGIYVTITGIPGLERLYQEAQKLGLKLYSNDPQTVPGSEKLLPRIVPNPRIKLQFARSGWGSVWLSQLSGTPLVVPDFDPKDDPEIYFNNLCIEKLGLGIIYRGQPLKEILAEAESLNPKIKAINKKLMDLFGTYDGNQYCAKIIVDDFIKR